MYNARYLQPQVSTKGLLAHWKLWDGLMTSGKVFDYSLDGHTGTLVDTDDPITLRPAYPGLDFDGTNDYVEVADHADFSFGDGTNDSPFSISAWIYMDSATSFSIVSKFVAAGDNREWFFATDASDKLGFVIYELDGSHFRGRKYNTALSTGQWYHIVATYDGTGGTTAETGINIYIDEAVKDDTNITHLPDGAYVAMDNGTAVVQIGRKDTLEYGDGKIDDVMIFNRELPAQEIKSIYGVTRQRYGV